MRPLLAIFLLLTGLVNSDPRSKKHTAAPRQPIAFSHKLHSGIGLSCRFCHATPDAGEAAGLPAASLCMECHCEIRKDVPEIRKLKAFHKRAEVVPWARVYRLPAFVFFSHKTHVDAAFACSECHGPVEQRDTLSKEKDISMKACVNCHQAKAATVACNACHELTL